MQIEGRSMNTVISFQRLLIRPRSTLPENRALPYAQLVPPSSADHRGECWDRYLLGEIVYGLVRTFYYPEF